MRYEAQIKAGSMVLAIALSFLPCQAQDLKVSYAYNLSDFTGTIPVSYAGLTVDRDRGETYLVHQNVVRIFNSSGMETFQFGDPDPGLMILGVTVAVDDIFALVRNYSRRDESSPWLIQHRNYRGDLLATLEIAGLPADLPELDPTKIFYRDGHLLLVDKAQMLVVETDLTGTVTKLHDIAELLGIQATDDGSVRIFGFDVDANGNMLLTIPTLFTAFVISPNGTVRGFGKGGSVPGTFGIAAGITSDAHGRTYVADRLRSVVMVFDANDKFVTEFGYRGRQPENLINPSELVIDNSGKLYVTQRRNRGVAVFKVTHTDRTDPESVQANNHEKEVLAETVGESNQQSLNRTDSGFDTNRSNTTPTADVGPNAEPHHDGLGTRVATPGRRHEEKS